MGGWFRHRGLRGLQQRQDGHCAWLTAAHPTRSQEALELLRAASPYGAQALQQGGRMGLDGTLHRVSAMRARDGRVLGLTYRIGRHVPSALLRGWVGDFED